MIFNWNLVDKARKAETSIPTQASIIIGNGVGTGGGGSGLILLGTGGRSYWRAATWEKFFVSSSIMMEITCDIPDCFLIDLLNFSCQFPFPELSVSLLRILFLIVQCFLMEDLPLFDPCQDVSSSFCSMEIFINSCQVWQRRSTLVLPRPENVTAETLTGFGFVRLDYVDIR